MHSAQLAPKRHPRAQDRLAKSLHRAALLEFRVGFSFILFAALVWYQTPSSIPHYATIILLHNEQQQERVFNSQLQIA